MYTASAKRRKNFNAPMGDNVQGVRLDSDDDDAPKLTDAELDGLYHVAVRVTRRHA